jgi:hypothetical protein
MIEIQLMNGGPPADMCRSGLWGTRGVGAADSRRGCPSMGRSSRRRDTLAGGVAYVAHRTPQYAGDVQVLFTRLASGDDARGLTASSRFGGPARDAQTGVTLLGGPRAAALAVRRLGRAWSARRVQQATTIVQTGQGNIIAAESRAQSPALSTRLAIEFAQASLDVHRAQLRTDALIVPHGGGPPRGPNGQPSIPVTDDGVLRGW